MKRTALFALALAMGLAPAGALGAPHIKPGLWSISTMTQMPNMPQIPPETMAKMKAMGIKMPVQGQPFTIKQCVTPAQAAMDKPPQTQRQDSGCQSQNVRWDGNTATAEVVCNGKLTGKGTSRMTITGMEHYAGRYDFTGTSEGHPVEIHSTMRGDYLGADCGDVKPLNY